MLAAMSPSFSGSSRKSINAGAIAPELKAMAAECDDFNNKALSADAQFPHCFGMWQTHPSHLETSVSV